MALPRRGGTGGHNGLKSIRQTFGGSTRFPRLRIGVGDPDRPPGGPLTDFVLGTVGRREAAVIRALFPTLTECVEAWVRGGNQAALDVQSRAGRAAEPPGPAD